MGKEQRNRENDHLSSHTNGTLETTANDDEIFKKPDPPVLWVKNAKMNNCQAVVPPMNSKSVQRKRRNLPTSTVTSSSLLEVDEDEAIDDVIEFENEDTETDVSYSMLNELHFLN